MTWSVVVPTCREDLYAEFVTSWTPLFEKHNVDLIPVWDIDGKRDDMPWFIPTGTDMIRSWGIYKAWQKGSTYTLTLDDDVRPSRFDPFDEYEAAFDHGAVCSPYFSVGQLTESPYEMRGFPYKDRKTAEVVVQYGGWSGTLDYDAATQITTNPGWEAFSPHVVTIPRGTPVTTCIMNAAWRTEYAPIMWQLPMLDGKYNRFGDIWSGLIQKKVLDMIGSVMLINGRASVRHDRASDPIKNLAREVPGIEINESLWGVLGWHEQMQAARSFSVRDDTHLREIQYRIVATWAAEAFPDDYRDYFLKAVDGWLALFA